MKRLRENSMSEAEISDSGNVLVEGHHVGQLQGFRFTADAAAEGPDAKAVKAAAQKALAREFETRSERFSIAANGDLALGSDGVLRWLGGPVATLSAGEDWMAPRVILLADEQLTGPARDKVAARAERFVAHHLQTVLKPLFDLKAAEQLSGIARGVAFRLVEHYGLLNRRDVAEDVRSLDQDARGAMRRLGVRFGFYHIFVPMLLKPAPAGLLTLLWALQNDGKEKTGYGEVVNSLASGRTSVVTDGTFERDFYRLAGYRLLGQRAVRVDILERLADLIRPALAWKSGQGIRPDGAYDGRNFIVTPAMMSILGATADDMEQILKSLGYRCEEKPAAEIMSQLERTAAPDRSGAAGVSSEESSQADSAAGTPTSLAGTAAAESDSKAEAPFAVMEAVRDDKPAEEQVEPAAEQAAADAAQSEAVEAEKTILLWRQAGPDSRGRKRKGPRPASRDETSQGPRKHGPKSPKGSHRSSAARHQQGQGKPRPERKKPIDPDSPFAKLAALKEQMKK